MRMVAALGIVLILTGCTTVQDLFKRAPNSAASDVERPDDAPETDEKVVSLAPVAADAPPPSAAARTVEQFDTTTAAERVEAAEAPAPSTQARLGTTVASLGNPADPGFWAETPLVSAPRPGRLEYNATGKSVLVELRPSGGAAGSGTRVSLPALRVLEAPLTALPELVVFGL